jgi:outer membrane lipoprotein-sorting protein
LLRRSRFLALGLLLSGVAFGVPPPENSRAWEWLIDVRERLQTEAPLIADFSQNFVPVGFSSGDEETGTVSLNLPECVRWDYREPFPKTFLLCSDQAYSWNEGEPSGRFYRLDSADQEGLDLLRLRVEELNVRYSATILEEEAGSVTVRLTPLDTESAIVEALLTISRSDLELQSLTYRDREGNRTRFALSLYRPLDAPRAFEPPEDLTWIED